MQAVYHPKVLSEDIPRLNKNIAERIKKAIEQRLMAAPEKYGARLRKGLGGYWKLRAGDYRVIYKIAESRHSAEIRPFGRGSVEQEVRIMVIGHRKDVYSEAGSRIY
ncbi:type II toxin-antitoxin system RelE/ParE family toxin [Candidatus Desantisbacteria bacterium CG_4_10_14_0_8_um_filter_48_22]|uniref:Type II toxin-antitoxin system RelE/ParE family toxin n=1 Tax=Candidatus Desantisbacteria bacterium CG_4_10_14_0_8_um_filter_48_22 TaxID=1974543 RepID=A0A2M7S8Y4_9BACT|nr:MAG: hypothetical protein AUJ67_08355 [Candidatus Desantisbacteria bacterium CG1_02_49_89]PIV56988.1 MAG: type II toxin-antitoxin system RelE/ParE family toxin [Candidatus Desantisbacteria bacterium CG02_land_8_20_14_3_00_49_13]PIZ15984.1 MAG: type II toxin-antitoxin system RelE/ParE family toxin [Candidatus Desantisbacteria bacterium CG_4_10_14_0_8_um_filter_48_22]PJB28667.1 MAG: type II toxin-antitoxin system RelE/ParE family toxin [Candidatus Desantisbacteria bacterium CG_4_9_14_3_um_filte